MEEHRMTALEELLEENVLALQYRQRLEPVDGRDTAVYPPTYAPPPDGPRPDTPYPISVLHDGTRVVSLDSIQSQANRMENTFGTDGDLNSFVPKVGVRVRRAADPTSSAMAKHVTELGHRIADAAIRATAHAEDIRRAFNAYADADCLPMARLCPTALLYGAWDSRDTRVKIPRLVRAEIVARDVHPLSRPAQYTGAFSREDLGMSEKDWDTKVGRKGSRASVAGYAHSPSDGHGRGGVAVRGEMFQSAVIHLGALSELRRRAVGEELHRYLLCLALAALLDPRGGRDYNLRSGCWLMPDGPPTVTLATRWGERHTLDIEPERPLEWLQEASAAVRRPPVNIDMDTDRFEDFDHDRAREALVEAGKRGEKDSDAS